MVDSLKEFKLPPLGEVKDPKAAPPAILARMYGAQTQGVPSLVSPLLAAHDTANIKFATDLTGEPMTREQRAELLRNVLEQHSYWEAKKIANPGITDLALMTRPPDTDVVLLIRNEYQTFFNQIIEAASRGMHQLIDPETLEVIKVYLSSRPTKQPIEK